MERAGLEVAGGCELGGSGPVGVESSSSTAWFISIEIEAFITVRSG